MVGRWSLGDEDEGDPLLAGNPDVEPWSVPVPSPALPAVTMQVAGVVPPLFSGLNGIFEALSRPEALFGVRVAPF